MATEAGGTRPLTARVAGGGQSSVSYSLPSGLIQYVQSVVATVDTSASGDVQPLLTVHDDAGIVVADKQQGQAIDAGGSGRATWALRLTDEQRAGPNLNTQREQFFEVLTARAGLSDHFDFTTASIDGADLFDDHGGDDYPTIRTPGMYAFSASAQSRHADIANGVCAVIIALGVNLGHSFAFPRLDLAQSFPLDKFPKTGTVSPTWYMGVGAQIDVALENGAAVDIDCNVTIFVQRIT